MVPLAWWCPLLCGVADSGGFSEQVGRYIYIHTHTHREIAHRWTLYQCHNLTNVTSEGNWLHQILFRGFIAKGVNKYVLTTFLFFFFIFLISLHQFQVFYVCPLHEFQIKINLKLQVVMQQNRKNCRGMNTFARHCNLWNFFPSCI